jgi:hypothetical protein
MMIHTLRSTILNTPPQNRRRNTEYGIWNLLFVANPVLADEREGVTYVSRTEHTNGTVLVEATLHSPERRGGGKGP